MDKLGKDLTLRGLYIQSLLAMCITVVVPLMAMLDGKKVEVLSIFPFLFAGLIGIAAHQSISKVMKRIDELERRTNEIRRQE